MTNSETILNPTPIYELETLLQIGFPPAPPDFAAFWQNTYARALAIPPRISRRRVTGFDARFRVWEIEFDALGETRIGGWISIPRDGHFERGVVAGHGYGGRDTPQLDVPGPPAVVISPCARGFHRSARPELPAVSGRHVLHGIESRETYLHRGCVADLWAAASVLLELFPEIGEKLHYFGGSFGGGIGALMLPHDPRFTRAFLDVPSFGNHPLRVGLPCTGSGEAVRLLFEKQPQILEVLAYFDAATAASQIEIPVFVAAALCDPAVPPPGQFAVYNALKCEKKLFVRQTGHPDFPADETPLMQQLSEWFGAT